MQEENNTQSEMDIFDRILGWKLFKPIEKTYRRHKEIFLYLFFGGLAFLLNIILFFSLIRMTNVLIANIFAWVITVIFAFFTNRIWVFHSKVNGMWQITKEMISFGIGRLLTLLMEEAMLWIGITLLGINDLAVKLVAQFSVIVANYLISKFSVFKNKNL